MIPVRTPRDSFMMQHLINHEDYAFLKPQSKTIINTLKSLNNLPINEAIAQTKTYLDTILPNFFEVFLNQTNYCTMIQMQEASEKWKKMDWNLPIMDKITQSMFYESLLYGNLDDTNNHNFIFDDFIETFWLKNSTLNYLIYDFDDDNGFNKEVVFLPMNHSYIENLIKYFEMLDKSDNYRSYLDIMTYFLDKMYYYRGVYEELNDVLIDPSFYENHWKKYLLDPKQYLIDYLRQYQSKWQIEDLK